MGISIKSPTLPVIRREYAPMVYTRSKWGDDWQLQPEIIPTAIQVCSASHGVSTCTISRRFGLTKLPWESGTSLKPLWAGGIGQWVMVAMCDDRGYQPVFHGRIVADSRNLGGSDYGVMGIQSWPVRGPLDILDGICISKSTWAVGGVVKTLDHIPPLNTQSSTGVVVGNRSTTERQNGSEDRTSYHYGDDREWTYLQYLNYILTQFVNDPDDDDVPTWTVGGDAKLLSALNEPIKFSQTQTAGDVIAKLIPRSKGLDYSIVTTDDGFEIRVFTLNSRTIKFGATTVPGSKHRIDFNSGNGLFYSVSVAESGEQQYGKIRIIGKPLVVCCSLDGAQTDVAKFTGNTTLEPAWDSSEADDYNNCTGLDIPQTSTEEQISTADKYRQQDRFRSVYSAYSASDDFMDQSSYIVTPIITAEGKIDADVSGDHQYRARATLDWVPLYENVVYGEIESQDRAITMYSDDEEYTAELLPPMAWVGPASDATQVAGEDVKYQPVEKIGANVSALKKHFGLMIQGSPNHILAQELLPYTSETAYYDYNSLIITAAFETDQRLRLEYDVPGGDPTRIKELYIDAEAWWMPSNTCVGIDNHNQPIRTSFARELRNDQDKMIAAMVGAISRYGNPRARATIEFDGIALWSHFIGSILGTVTSGMVPHKIEAPITSVTWSLPGVDDSDGSAKTVVNTGYAQ